MSRATPSGIGDPQLVPFLEAPNDEAARAALDLLFAGEVEAVVAAAVQRSLGGPGPATRHADDILGDVRLSLVRRLWLLRAGIGEPIENFLGYVATAAEHGCYAFLRRHYPERTRFRNRVRYALGHHHGTTLARDADGRWQCSTRATVRAVPAEGATRAFLDDPRGWLAAARVDTAQPLPGLLDALLARLDRAIELDRLVEALAGVLGVADRGPLASRYDDEGGALALDQLPDPAPAIGDVLERREDLRKVWSEIVELPFRQRAALLLNLRDPEGGAVLQLLVSIGVLSPGDIAAALDIPADQLPGLWPLLPLDDLAVASRLGVTRQQVINLRKAARARLARRLGSSGTGR